MAAKKTPKKVASAKVAGEAAANNDAPTASPKKPVKKPSAAKKAAKPAASKPASAKSASPKKTAAAGENPPSAVPPKEEAHAPSAEPAASSAPVKRAASASKASHSPVFIQKQRQRLLDLRDDLVDAMSGMTRDTIRNAPEGSEASGSGMHQGDAGSDAYDRDFALSVLAKEQDALYEIEQALRRIQQGSYGVCELSGEKIPTPRLEAIPFARLTVICQAQWEKEYGNRRFRPSNEVGFSGGSYLDEEESDAVSLDEDDD